MALWSEYVWVWVNQTLLFACIERMFFEEKKKNYFVFVHLINMCVCECICLCVHKNINKLYETKWNETSFCRYNLRTHWQEILSALGLIRFSTGNLTIISSSGFMYGSRTLSFCLPSNSLKAYVIKLRVI